jgi:hypothetical protein
MGHQDRLTQRATMTKHVLVDDVILYDDVCVANSTRVDEVDRVGTKICVCEQRRPVPRSCILSKDTVSASNCEGTYGWHTTSYICCDTAGNTRVTRDVVKASILMTLRLGEYLKERLVSSSSLARLRFYTGRSTSKPSRAEPQSSRYVHSDTDSTERAI